MKRFYTSIRYMLRLTEGNCTGTKEIRDDKKRQLNYIFARLGKGQWIG